jgi:hypothetical protein
MPQIRDYTTQISAESDIGGRRATPQDFGAGVGDVLGRGVDDVTTKLADVAQRQEVSDVHAKLAQARATWTVELANRAAAAPAGDGTFADKFQTDFSDYLAQMGGNYSTRAGQMALQEGSAELAAHFTAAAGLYQAKSAGDKALTDYGALLQSNRTTLLHDPSQFDSVLKTTTAALNDPNGLYAKMPADKRYELGVTTAQDLAKSAVEGLIRTDPQAGLAALKDGKFDQYLKGDAAYTLEKQATIAINAQEIQAERAQRLAEKAQKAQEDAIGSDWLNRLQPDAQNPLSAKDILNAPVSTTFKEHWIGMLDRANKPDPLTQVSNANATQLFADMRRPDGDPLKITDTKAIDDKYIAGGLTRTDHDWLVKQFTENRDEQGQRLSKRQADFVASIKNAIDKANPLTGKSLDPTGPQQYYAFVRYVDSKVQQYRQAGKDPFDLLDPAKPDFLGKPETVQMFQKTMKESLAYMSSQLSRQPGAVAPVGAVPPDKQRQPGESIADYLKRTGGR